jgi:DNA-binding NtrC family response regulator
MVKILVVDDHPELRKRLVQVVAGKGEVTEAESEAQANELIRDRDFDVVITDLRLNPDNPKDTGGFEVLRAGRQKNPILQVIIVTSSGELEDSVEAMNLQAFDYLERNNRRIDFDHVLHRKLEMAIDYKTSLRFEKEGTR